MKSPLTFAETGKLLALAFEGVSPEKSRSRIFQRLSELNSSEAQFHEAIEKHLQTLNLTSSEWLRLFQMYPSSVFRSRFEPRRLLSENDLAKLKE